MHTSPIQNNVMRHVRRIYYLRKILHPTLIKIYGGTLFLSGLASLVSIPSVLANTPMNLSGALRYLVGSLVSTDVVVQTLCLSLVVITGMVMRDMVRRVPTHRFLHIHRSA